MLRQRWQSPAWREAFRSLYMAVQAGVCHAFYFMTPQVHAAASLIPYYALAFQQADLHLSEALFLWEPVVDHVLLLEGLRWGLCLTVAERVLHRTPRSPLWPTLARRARWGGRACPPG